VGNDTSKKGRQGAAGAAAADEPAVTEQPELAGDALQERAKALELPGRSDMSADELRDAVARLDALQGDELDARAKALGVEGRSSMKTDEVRAAIAQAEAKGGSQTPPAPPTGSGAADTAGGEFPKDTLIKRSESLLGYPRALVAGVLAEAEDPITIDAARTRIQDYLDAPVANTEEA
jgi:hypothetical protein